jgi:hypothetical protein
MQCAMRGKKIQERDWQHFIRSRKNAAKIQKARRFAELYRAGIEED